MSRRESIEGSERFLLMGAALGVVDVRRKDQAILVFVDPETEHYISRALELVMVDRTVFIIAHRLSTVKAADLVIKLSPK